jgi:hypothetical protein
MKKPEVGDIVMYGSLALDEMKPIPYLVLEVVDDPLAVKNKSMCCRTLRLTDGYMTTKLFLTFLISEVI